MSSLRKLGWRFPLARLLPGVAVALLWALGAAPSAAVAPPVTLAWDANPEPDIAGYRLHYGPAGGGPVTTMDVGNVTTVELTTLDEGTAYAVVVTAINTGQLESPPSNEISLTFYTRWAGLAGLTGDDALPVPDQNGNGGNPDLDIYSNLLDYALALEPGSGGAGDSGPRLEENAGGNGIDVVFERPEGVADVRYFLEASEDLESWVPVTSILPTVTPPANGKEVIRFTNLDQIDGLTSEGIDVSGRGFARLGVTLAGPDVSGYTQVFGWERSTIATQPESFGYPMNRKLVFSGTVDGITGNNFLEVATSAGTGNVRNLLDAAAPYYVELLDGPWEGHRFDVEVAGSDTDTIALAAGSPGNTRDPIPDLTGSAFILRRHLILDEVFPRDRFAGSSDADTADRLFCHSNGAWQIVYLLDTGIQTQWTIQGDGSFTDQGGRIVKPGEGFVVHPRLQAVTLTRLGVVRAHDFVAPLTQGFNFVAGGWPLDQSLSDRNMTIANGFFFGSTDPANTDQIHIRRGDTQPGQPGHRGYWLLDAGAPYQYWAELGDSSVANQNQATLFEGNRAALIRVTGDRPDYRMSLPWTP